MSTEIQQTSDQITPNSDATVNNIEQPAAVVTPAEQQKQEPVVPEKYDLKLADGAKLDPAYIESFSAFAKERKMTQEQAQEYLNREASAVDTYAQKQEKEFEALKSTWIEEIKSDSELGGEQFAKNVELAKRALEKFGTQKFIQDLDATGYGNHPELVRIFSRIGKLIAEDKMVTPGANSGGQKSYEDIFYGQKTN